MKAHAALATLALAGGLNTPSAFAQTVSMSGTFTGKALLIIDGAPRTLVVGETARGVKLLSVSSSEAVVEVKGKRVPLGLGGAQVNLGSADSDAGGSRIVLTAGSGGHFLTSGSINGKSVRLMVDTGASAVAIGVAQATDLGIDYLKGERGTVGTANGAVPAYRVSLSSVRVGDVTVYNVDAIVIPVGMPYILLGNTFLSRFQMKRENDVMTLSKRF